MNRVARLMCCSVNPVPMAIPGGGPPSSAVVSPPTTIPKTSARQNASPNIPASSAGRIDA